MMPYIAILIDSFWETVGNRILWALLIGWSIILAGLAPFGYVTERTYQLVSGDINNLDQLKAKLVAASQGEGPNSIKAVASKLNPDFIDSLKENPEGEKRGQRRVRSSDMARELNAAIEAPDLYSVDAFPTADKRQRLQALVEQVEDLSPDDREQLNRELLQLAFAYELNAPRAERLWIGYAGFKLGEPLNVSRQQIKQFIEPLLLGLIIKLGLGVVAVFVSLIVTSPIVPETFKSGSLHLLLSKPISRVWLYLFKFFGGCVFVLLNITFLLVGLYFIAGIRFDIWNEGLLACIPLLLFVFIIFYSVSALTGVIWGNAIVCVVSCIVFWMFCFALGAVHDGMMRHVEILPQVSRVEVIDGKLLAVNQRGEVGMWNEKFSIWQPAVDTDSMGEARTFGPLYDPNRQQILVKSFFRMPFGSLQARSRKLSVIRLKDQESVQTEVPEVPQSDAENLDGEDSGAEKTDAEKSSVDETAAIGTASESDQDENETEQTDAPDVAPNSTEVASSNAPQNDSSTDEIKPTVNREPKTMAEARETPYWMADPGPEIPAQLIDLLQVNGEVIAVCRGGLYRLNWEKDLGNAGSSGLLGMIRNFLPGTNAFENIAPKDFVLSDNSSASVTADKQGLIIYSSGDVHLMKLEGDQLKLLHSVRLDGEGTEPALVLANNNYCVVARDTLPIVVLDSQLQPLDATVELPSGMSIRELAWIPDSNSVAVITHVGEWWKFDCAEAKLNRFSASPAGALTTMNWQSPNEVLLGIKPNRVVKFDVASGKVAKDYKPQPSTLEYVFNWIVKPLYVVNPKPSALDNAMGYFLSGSATQSMNIVTSDMQQAQVKLDFWSPIVSNLAFVAVMLAIGSIYVARKEF